MERNQESESRRPIGSTKITKQSQNLILHALHNEKLVFLFQKVCLLHTIFRRVGIPHTTFQRDIQCGTIWSTDGILEVLEGINTLS